MYKQKKITDPLSDIDPVLEEAFSEDYPESEISAPNEGSSSSDVDVAKIKLPELENASSGTPISQNLFDDLTVKVSVELGRASMPLKELLALNEGAIVELNRLVGEPLDLVVNKQIVARGEIVAVNQSYGFRITQVLTKKSHS